MTDPFRAFAAVLGGKQARWVSFESYIRKEPHPVVREQVRNTFIIGLVASTDTQYPKTLGNEGCARFRIESFWNIAFTICIDYTLHSTPHLAERGIQLK